ncbi:hypothetical protein DV738_g574, partial [Chaetothyriales sp. CBS 135597]
MDCQKLVLFVPELLKPLAFPQELPWAQMLRWDDHTDDPIRYSPCVDEEALDANLTVMDLDELQPSFTQDIDEFIAYLQNGLGDFQQDFELCFTPPYGKGITQKLYTNFQGPEGLLPGNAPHLTKNIFFGTPLRLPAGVQKNVHLTNEELHMWTNKILFPALLQTMGGQFASRSHFPLSFDNAMLYMTGRIPYRKPIPQARLAAFWGNILDRLRANSVILPQFQDPYLLYTGFDYKLQYRSEDQLH